MERLFDPAKPHFAAWVWLYDIDHHWIEPMSTIHPTQPEAVPLYYAALCGFGGFVEHLIVSYSRTSIAGAVLTRLRYMPPQSRDMLEVTSLLLKNGADPNSRDHLGRVPLHRVSQGGELVMAESSLEIARLLVNSGANVNVADDEGWTPLHAAARSGYREIAEQLLESGATLDVRNEKQGVACQWDVDVAPSLSIEGDMNSRRGWLHSITHGIAIWTWTSHG
jgi:ankyrin repeat protein